MVAKRNERDTTNLVEGLFIRLCPELRESLIVAAKRGAPGLRRVHDDALKLQKRADLKRHQIEHEKNIENAKEQYQYNIVTCDYFDPHG